MYCPSSDVAAIMYCPTSDMAGVMYCLSSGGRAVCTVPGVTWQVLVLHLALVAGSITAMYGALHCSSQVLVRNKHAIMRSSVQLPDGDVL